MVSLLELDGETTVSDRGENGNGGTAALSCRGLVWLVVVVVEVESEDAVENVL